MKKYMNLKIRFIVFAVLTLVVFLLLATACVKDPIYIGPPSISALSITPNAPGPEDNIVVMCTVTDLQGVSNVKLFYKVNQGTFTSVDMTGGPVYTATIPAQQSDASVFYYVQATNTSQLVATLPQNAPTNVSFYKVGAPAILINELFSRGVVGDVDWIEIYNNSDKTVDISGYKIYDLGGKDGAKPKMEAPSGTILGPHGFYVFLVDDAATAFPAGSNFGLSSGGEDVWLENAAGFVIDQVALPAVTDANHSYGRKPDGSNNFFILINRSKGTTNNNSATL